MNRLSPNLNFKITFYNKVRYIYIFDTSTLSYRAVEFCRLDLSFNKSNTPTPTIVASKFFAENIII